MDLIRYTEKLDRAHFAAGDMICTKGEVGTVMYVIVRGEVDVRSDEVRSVRLGPGESFGEMSLIDKSPRSATVVAVSDVSLAPVNKATFLVLVQDTPHFALEVMRSLSDRLRRANEMQGAEG